MDFDLTDTQTMIKESVERFLSSEYDFTVRQLIASGAEGYSREMWHELAGLGLLGLTVPEASGGLGMGAVDLGIVMEAFGRALVIEPYLPTMIGAAAVASLGEASQRKAILPAVVEGRILLAFAHSERGASLDPTKIAATARRVTGGWILDGQKYAVVGAGAADYLIVTARILQGGIGLFLVPRGAPGLSIVSYPLIDGSRAADVELNGVTLGGDALLGRDEEAWGEVEALTDHFITALAAEALGVIDALVAATVDHARTRVQFGQPIGKLQVIQHRMAEMVVMKEEARSLSLLAVLSVNESKPVRARAVSAAKIKVGRAVKHTAEQAVQIHGAMGVTEELSIGSYLKRGIVFNLMFGSVEDHLRRYAAIGRGSDLLTRGLADRNTGTDAVQQASLAQ